MLQPPSGDINAPRKPDAALRQRILDKLPQPRCPAGLPGPARMEPDRHHLGIPYSPLSPQFLQPPLARVKEVGGTAVALGKDVARIIVGNGIRHNQVALVIDL